jgi:hypothetical protein
MWFFSERLAFSYPVFAFRTITIITCYFKFKSIFSIEIYTSTLDEILNFL